MKEVKNMKRILLSVMTIGLVSTVVFGATRAFFTDTEQKTGNTFSTGTIDIAVILPLLK